MYANSQTFLLALFVCVGNGFADETPDSVRKRIEPYFMVPPEFKNDFGTYKSIAFSPDKGDSWATKRAEILANWTEMLGQWPPLIKKPKVEVLESTLRESFTQQKIRFKWLPNQYTTGYLLIPNDIQQGERRPAVITVYYEPDTAIGLGKEHRDFALQLVRKGFVAFSIGTTETSNNKTYSLYYPSIDNATLQPLSALSYAAANAWHVLAAQANVDSDRIGIVGHSYGGKWAMFAGCLWEKFAAVAVSDPGIMLDADPDPNVNYWEPWYLGYTPPPWRKRGVITDENPTSGLYPKLIENDRELHELHSLLAPRPFLVSGGAVDPPSRWRALNHLVNLNQKLGFKNRVGMTNRPKHSPTSESNQIIVQFFQHFLNTK